MRENQEGIADILIVIFIVILIGVVVFLAFQNKPDKQQAVVTTQVTDVVTTPSSLSNPTGNEKLQEILEFSKYSAVDTNQTTPLLENIYRYDFTDGQDRDGNNHNNYYVEYPGSWKLFIYTSEENRDDYGTNIIFRKNNDYISIKQQLYETGTCVFEENDVKLMSYLCELVEKVENPNQAWKIFTVPGFSLTGNESDPWVKYGVCDQDNYSQNISSYKTPDEHDRKVCSPWGPVGEIEYFTISNNQANYKEFVGIAESIQVTE